MESFDAPIAHVLAIPEYNKQYIITDGGDLYEIQGPKFTAITAYGKVKSLKKIHTILEGVNADDRVFILNYDGKSPSGFLGIKKIMGEYVAEPPQSACNIM